jgi:hypothetical protein
MNHSRKLCKFDKLDLVEALDFRKSWRLKPAFKGSATRQSACEMLGIQLIRGFLQVNWSGAREFPDEKNFSKRRFIGHAWFQLLRVDLPPPKPCAPCPKPPRRSKPTPPKPN